MATKRKRNRKIIAICLLIGVALQLCMGSVHPVGRVSAQQESSIQTVKGEGTDSASKPAVEVGVNGEEFSQFTKQIRIERTLSDGKKETLIDTEKGVPGDPGTYELTVGDGDKLSVRYTFDVDGEAQMPGIYEKSFRILLPRVMNIPMEKRKAVIVEGKEIGTLIMHPAAGASAPYGEVLFREEAAFGEITYIENGYVEFEAEFKRSGDGTVDDSESWIAITESGEYNFTFEIPRILPTPDMAMKKVGKYIAKDNEASQGKTIEWTITITPSVNAPYNDRNFVLTEAVLREQIDTALGEAVSGSLLLKKDGRVVPEADRDFIKVNPAQSDGTNHTYDLAGNAKDGKDGSPGLLPGHTYTLIFKTFVEDSAIAGSSGGSVKIKNTADVVYKGQEPNDAEKKAQAENEVTIKVIEFTKAAQTNANGASGLSNHQIEWTLSLKSQRKMVDGMVEDSIPGSLELEDFYDGSTKAVKVMNHLADPASASYLTKAATEEECRNTPHTYFYVYDGSADGNKLTIHLGDLSNPQDLTISYVTKIVKFSSGTTDGKLQFKNSAILKEGVEKTGSASAVIGAGDSRRFLNKTSAGYNRNTHTIKWEVVITPKQDMYGMALSNAVLKDAIPPGLRLVQGELAAKDCIKVTVPNGISTPSIVVAEHQPEVDRQTIEISMGDITGADPITIQYETQVTDPKLWAGNVSKKDFVNDAELTANGNIKLVARKTVAMTSNVLQKKFVEYDYQKRELKWKLIINENKTKLHNITLEDIIPQDQLHSFTGNYEVVLSSNKDKEKLASIPDFFRVSDNGVSGSKKKLTLYFPEEIEGQWTLTYTTRVEEEFYKREHGSGAVMNNNASMTSSEVNTAGETVLVETKASSSTTISSALVTKYGTFNRDTNCIDWDVVVNKNQIKLDHAVLMDELASEDLVLDKTSFSLYPLILNKDGTLDAIDQAGKVREDILQAKEPVAITSQWIKDLENGKPGFQFCFQNTIEEPYLLRFSTKLAREYTTTCNFSNKIQFKGMAGQMDSSENSVVVEMIDGNIGAGGQASAGILTVKKKDDKGSPLENVGFTLYNALGEKADNGYTDASGTVVFRNISLYRNYTLKETGPLAGYLPVDPKQVYLKKDHTKGEGFTLGLVNKKIPDALTTGTISIYKVDSQGLLLPGAVFQLLDQSGNKVKDKNGRDSWITEANGTAAIEGIELNQTYFIRETGAPKYYQARPDKEIFMNQYTYEVEFVNDLEPGRIKLIKKADGLQGSYLAGAEFELLDAGRNLFAGPFKTNGAGEILFAGLTPGNTYILRERKAPEGYLLDLEEKEMVIPMDGREIEVIWMNKKNPEPAPVPSPEPTLAPVPSQNPEPTLVPVPSPVNPPPNPDQGGSKNPMNPDPVPPVGNTPEPTATPMPSASPSPETVSPIAPEKTVKPKKTLEPNHIITEITDNETPVSGVIPIPKGGVSTVKEPPKFGRAAVEQDGNWQYTPNKGYVGKDDFVVQIESPEGDKSEVLVELDVQLPLAGVMGEELESAALGAALPQTGTMSAILFFAWGLVLAGAGAAVLCKKDKK